jgi:hypothetical protein
VRSCKTRLVRGSFRRRSRSRNIPPAREARSVLVGTVLVEQTYEVGGCAGAVNPILHRGVGGGLSAWANVVLVGLTVYPQ